MKKQADWDPDLYLKFNNERTRPSTDLVSKIRLDSPARIIDIGCGPGNSTRVLLNRWPLSHITGIDNSPAMIEKAVSDYPEQEWKLADASTLDPSCKYDLVFSNAAIQWIPDHKQLINSLWEITGTNGALAAQVPLHHMMPVCQAIEDAAGRWPDKTKDVMNIFTFHAPEFYYDIISSFNAETELWVTDYYHVMGSHAEITEMMKSTGMKPYLEKLDNDSERAEFESTVLKNIIKAYPAQSNGRVLFPFKRLFFVVYR